MPTPWFSPHSTFGSSVAGRRSSQLPPWRPLAPQKQEMVIVLQPPVPPKNPSVSTFLSPLNEQKEQNGQKTDV